jgi:hypothetical protein
MMALTLPSTRLVLVWTKRIMSLLTPTEDDMSGSRAVDVYFCQSAHRRSDVRMMPRIDGSGSNLGSCASNLDRALERDRNGGRRHESVHPLSLPVKK